MAKQIYIDENGNPIEVSGTINNASMLPISANDSTGTKTYIDSGFTTSDITSQVTFNENVSGTYTKIYLKGGNVFVNYHGQLKTHSQGDLIFTLPSDYKPTSQIVFAFILSDNGYGNGYIATNGECHINQVNGGGSQGRLFFNLTYPIA